jgi:hypothetical protein
MVVRREIFQKKVTFPHPHPPRNSLFKKSVLSKPQGRVQREPLPSLLAIDGQADPGRGSRQEEAKVGAASPLARAESPAATSGEQDWTAIQLVPSRLSSAT